MQTTVQDNARTDPRGTTIDPLSVTIIEAVRLTGLSRSEIYRRLACGDLEAIKAGQAGGRTLIVFASLKAHVARLPRATFRKPQAAR